MLTNQVLAPFASRLLEALSVQFIGNVGSIDVPSYDVLTGQCAPIPIRLQHE